MPHCLMYKEGDSHEVRGVKCDFERIHIRQINEYKEKGFKSDPSELYSQSEDKGLLGLVAEKKKDRRPKAKEAE